MGRKSALKKDGKYGKLMPVMLFEKETLSAQGKASVLATLFQTVAEENGVDSANAHVPMAVLDAHGELTTHVRFLLEAAAHRKNSKEEHKQLRKIDKLLDSLPESILYTLQAKASDNWMHLYRKLVQLHSLLDDTLPNPDVDEYTAIVQKIVHLAVTVADAAAVKINPASMFTLLLMQVHLHKYAPKKPKRTKKQPKNKAKGTKKSTAKKEKQ